MLTPSVTIMSRDGPTVPKKSMPKNKTSCSTPHEARIRSVFYIFPEWNVLRYNLYTVLPHGHSTTNTGQKGQISEVLQCLIPPLQVLPLSQVEMPLSKPVLQFIGLRSIVRWHLDQMDSHGTLPNEQLKF